MKQRVLVDTSALVGAALRAGSKPDQALKLVLDKCEFCISSETLSELEVVLARQQFGRYISPEARQAFVDSIRTSGQIYVVNSAHLGAVDPVCRDAKDNMVLALAVAANADAIVSSDNDLLILHPWRGIPILTPAQFLAQFKIEEQQ